MRVDNSAGNAAEVFAAFLKLGLTSFGGPVAHLGYFRAEFVERRKWLSESSYADLVALCQFLPGPASSQVGIAIGLSRGGYLGALAAWTAFTLPSAIILVLFAYGLTAAGNGYGGGWLHGLKVAAVAVVATAILGMARTLAPDRERATLAIAAMVIAFAVPSAWGQIAAILLGAAVGMLRLRTALPADQAVLPLPVGRTTGVIALSIFAVLLVALPLLASLTGNSSLRLFDTFYRVGSLVFGGGHVVLPLLQAQVVTPGWVTNESFLAGYGLAQAVPGPLFTFAAYLGAVMAPPPNGVAGAAIALVALLLPGMLLVYGMLPFWDVLRTRPAAQAAMRGTNAAVVGILGAALYNPVWTSAVLTQHDFALALGGFLLLTVWKLPPWIVVALLAAAGTLSGLV